MLETLNRVSPVQHNNNRWTNTEDEDVFDEEEDDVLDEKEGVFMYEEDTNNKIEIFGDLVYDKEEIDDDDKVEDHPTKTVEYLDAYGNDKGSLREEAASENWQAYQNFLLNAGAKSRKADEDMFAGEKDLPSKKKESKLEGDPMVPLE